MKYGKVFLTAALAVALFSGIAYAQIAGTFRLPYDTNQHWSDCGDVGFKLKADLVFMQLNTDLASGPKYHLAEDWNGKCGYSTDLGAPLYAIADGVVELASMPGDNGGWLLIRHPLPNGTSRWILYEHVLDIVVSSGPVYAGQLVAHLGDGNGFYPNAAHLHLEMRRTLFTAYSDPFRNLTQTPYYNPLTAQTAMLYSSPSLFIDDRNNAVVQNLPQGQWTNFYQSANAPSSTAYIEVNGTRHSLQRAATLGFIYQYVYFQKNGSWYYYPDITQVFFEAGSTYWVYAFVPGTQLNILVPGHRYKDDRAKIDMIRAVNGNASFARVYTQYISTWSDASFDYWMMAFSNDSDSALRYSYVAQATYKLNPLVRYTMYNSTGSWTPWVSVDWNTLD